MTDDAVKRRLTTILAADVVGYSRLMACDEPGTLADFKAIKAEVLYPQAAAHGGRVVNIIGDSTLMEFGSVVDAVNCAVAIQADLEARSSDKPDERRFSLRIGLNIGDVIVDDDAIFGNGVNVASRLEGLAEPGGVCVSGSVFDQVRDKVDLDFVDFGTHEVKNIPEPVRCYQIRSANRPRPVPQAGRSRRRRSLSAVAAVLFLLAAGAIGWQVFTVPRYQPASAARMAFPLPDKPSIAVLPFRSATPDAGQISFAEGISEDLITDLSKISGLFVIARNSSFVYRGEEVSIAQVSEDLGVRYVLVGSVRTAGGQLRVNAQLVDATTGGQVWADRFDGEMANVFDVQDRFVVRIVDALELELSDAEEQEIVKTDTRQVEAKEAFQRGWDLYSRFNATDNARSVAHFQRAIELDPEYGRAYGALALVYMRASVFNWDAEIGIHEANLYHEYVPRALKEAKAHGTALVHVVQAMRQLFYRDRYVADQVDRIGVNSGTDNALKEAARAIALQPSDPEAHIMMAWAQIASGKPGEGLSFIAAAKRLNPKDRPSHYVYFEAAAHIGLGDFEKAAAVLRQGLIEDPQAAALAPLAAAVNAHLGHRDEAIAAMALWKPGLNREDLQQVVRLHFFAIQWAGSQAWLNQYLKDGLFLATLPLEVTVTTLRDRLRDGGDQDLVPTVRALGWFGTRASDAVDDLIGLLKTDRRSLRREAVITLGKIGPAAADALPLLEGMVDEPLIGFHARAAIEKIKA